MSDATWRSGVVSCLQDEFMISAHRGYDDPEFSEPRNRDVGEDGSKIFEEMRKIAKEL
jgi:hypothetical protein